eukprot:4566935-Pyramimonas_sp.AAC.1
MCTAHLPPAVSPPLLHHTTSNRPTSNHFALQRAMTGPKANEQRNLLRAHELANAAQGVSQRPPDNNVADADLCAE